MNLYVGIDVGIRNLSICFANSNGLIVKCVPIVEIVSWEVHDLGYKVKLHEAISRIYEILSNQYERLLQTSTKIVIEQQLGRTNPYMLAVAHAIQMCLLSFQIPNERIVFENSNVKFRAARRVGFAFEVDPKECTSAAQKRIAVKDNAIELAVECAYAEVGSGNHADKVAMGPRKLRENYADSLGLIIGHLLNANE